MNVKGERNENGKHDEYFFFFKPHFDFKTRPVILSPKALGKKHLYWGLLPGVAKTSELSDNKSFRQKAFHQLHFGSDLI